MKTLDIIIVNWNSGKQLLKCLESIQRTSKDGYILSNVIVVDNNSDDNSLKRLETIEIPLKIIRNKTNKGFAAACNQGARFSNADYILFLNPDVVLFENSISNPIDFMNKEENSDIGICGIQLIDQNSNVSQTCSRFPKATYFISKMILLNKVIKKVNHHMFEWDHKTSKVVDQVIGAFFLIRKGIFDELDGFDERFFMYFEEVDVSIRAKKLGYKSFYLSDTQAYHRGGGTSEQVKARRLFYSLRSRILYAFKHFNLPSALILLWATFFVEPISRICLGILRFSLSEMKEVVEAYILLWKDIPNIWRLSR